MPTPPAKSGIIFPPAPPPLRNQGGAPPAPPPLRNGGDFPPAPPAPPVRSGDNFPPPPPVLFAGGVDFLPARANGKTGIYVLINNHTIISKSSGNQRVVLWLNGNTWSYGDRSFSLSVCMLTLIHKLQ